MDTPQATVTVRKPQRRRPVFHPLTVAEVRRLTDDAVAVEFAVPEPLRELFAFSPGQHLTVRRVDDGAEVRRSYSISSTPAELATGGVVRIGVRRVAGGAFSERATRELRTGDVVEVLPPLGHFTTALDAARARHYGAVAAGSGITPVLSLIGSALTTEPGSRVTLLYGNREAASVMFADELADLKDQFPDRLQVVHVLSREAQLSPLLSGRLDAARLRDILASTLVDASTVDEWFLCGPYGMVIDAQGVLAERGVPAPSVHTELFHVEAEPVVRTHDTGPDPSAIAATLTVRLDGRESTVAMAPGERVLDAALRIRPELPYACKGGVCSTCRARLIDGEVEMARNYALEPDDVAAGYVLTCQSAPRTSALVVDYDA
jgi:ring-1,2-phenylacetyl-CoA epoxidase subunit PaaE